MKFSSRLRATAHPRLENPLNINLKSTCRVVEECMYVCMYVHSSDVKRYVFGWVMLYNKVPFRMRNYVEWLIYNIIID